jgi:colanic acid/amylovoran biosynthesis glycosyltransferase
MKVSFTTFDAPDFVGGPNSWLRRVVPRLQDGGWNVDVRFYIERGPAETCPCYRALTAIGIPCRAMSSHEPMFEQVRWLLRGLAESPPDVFVINLGGAGYLATRWIRRAGIPSIGILHSDDALYRRIFDEFVTGPAGNCLTDVVCVSDFLLRSADGVATSTGRHLIPYGVPIPDRSVGPGRDTVRLIYVGRLIEEQKRISTVTKALCRAVREVPGTEAIIYGNGPDRDKVERYLAAEGMGDVVQLGGQVDNASIQDVMLQADILVLLSDYEGLPIALLEAMACGLVPVCRRIRSGVEQLVEHGTSGFLVDDGGDQFVDAIRTLAENPGLRSRMSTAAKRAVASQYSEERNAEHWLELLNARAASRLNLEAVATGLHRGVRALEFLERTVTKSNERAERSS